MDRREKLRVGVLADASVLVGRDVGRIDRAKGQDERPAPGERLSPDSRMAGLAIGGADEITPTLDEARILEARRNAGRIGQLRVAQRNPVSAREIGRSGAKDVPADESEGSDGNKRGRRKQDAPEVSSRGFPRRELLAIDGETSQRTPVAANSALASAGPAIEVPGSPMPPGASPFRTRWTSIAGASLIRIIR